MEIHRHMLAQYGQSTMSQRKVYEWVEELQKTAFRQESHVNALLGHA